MVYNKYLPKVIGVVVLVFGIFACSTHCVSAHKIQKFFRDHSAQEQIVFAEKNDAQRAYETLLKFCDNDKEKLDQVHDIKKLTGGFSSAIIFAFTFQEHSYVGRLFPSHYDQQEMLQEVNAQSAVADVGYAPKIYVYDLQKRSVIMDLVQGKNINNPALPYDESLLRQCAIALRTIHSITQLSVSDLQIHTYAKNRIGLDAQKYVDICAEMFSSSSVIQDLQTCVLQLCDVVNSAEHVVALTHNDIHCGNILIDDSGCVKIIDWTDAGFDNPMNDCAILLNEYKPSMSTEEDFVTCYFSPVRCEKFLTCYLNRSPSLQESAWLRVLIHLYRIEVIAKVISNANVSATVNDSFQEALKKSIDVYVKSGIWDLELEQKSGFQVYTFEKWITEIKRYIAQELDADKKLLLKKI